MIGEGVRSRAVLSPAIPPLIVALIFKDNSIVWTLAAIMSAGWLAFVAWRSWRMTKATTTRADRKYDRDGKFKLSSEYHDSYSATAAKRTKR